MSCEVKNTILNKIYFDDKTEYTPDLLVVLLDKSLYEMAFRDILAIREKKVASMSCFVLLSCFIDYLSGYYSGSKKTTKRYFLEFCERYLPRYDANVLYKDIRCKLVHQYTEPRSLIFSDSSKREHLGKYQDRLIMDLDTFIEDIESAWLEYRSDIMKDEQIYKKALKRYLENGTLNKLGTV